MNLAQIQLNPPSIYIVEPSLTHVNPYEPLTCWNEACNDLFFMWMSNIYM